MIVTETAEESAMLNAMRAAPRCWRCKVSAGIVATGDEVGAPECVTCAAASMRRMRAMLDEIDRAVRDGLTAYPRNANRVDFVRECIYLHRQDAARAERVAGL